MVVLDDRKESLFADDADDGFVFTHVVLHFLLDVGVVFEQILQVLLAVSQIFLEFAVLLEEVTVDMLDFVAFVEGQVELFLSFSNYFFSFS